MGKSLFILCLFFGIQGLAQTNVEDSLLAAKPDSLSAKALLEYTSSILRSSPQRAVFLFEQAEQRSEQVPSILSKICNQRAIAYYYLGKIDSCLIFFEKAQYVIQESNPVNAAEIAANIATIYISQQQFAKGILKLEALLPILDKLPRPKANILKSLADAYHKIGIEDKALYYVNAALLTLTDSAENVLLGSYWNLKGNILKSLSQYEAAIESYQNSLTHYQNAQDLRGQGSVLNNLGLLYEQTGKLDMAQKNYSLALQAARESQNLESQSATLVNLASLAERSGQVNLAIELFEQAYLFKQTNSLQSGLDVVLTRLSDLYLHFGNTTKAISCANQVLEIGQKTGSYYSLMYAYKNLAAAEAQRNNFKKAYDYHLLYKQASDSVVNSDKLIESGKVEGRYQTLVEIERQKQEELRRQAEIEAKIERQNTLSTRLVSFMLLFLVMLLVAFSRKITPTAIETYSVFLLLVAFEFVFLLLEPSIDAMADKNQLYKLFLNTATALTLLPLERLFRYVLLTLANKKLYPSNN